MNAAELAEAIAAVVAADESIGKASARKRGRNPRFPYVPVIERPSQRFGTSTRQVLARAFAERADAVDFAQATIDRAREQLASDLAEPRHRALREHYGLPREVQP